MRAFIYFITTMINKVVQVLDVYIFPDMSITYLQLILACIIITVIFKLIYGGLKENSHLGNSFIKGVKITTDVSKSISNSNRKKQIVDEDE